MDEEEGGTRRKKGRRGRMTVKKKKEHTTINEAQGQKPLSLQLVKKQFLHRSIAKDHRFPPGGT